MLHILLMILKIVGIILLCVIGIFLLLIALVLFVPLRYRIKASKEETIYAKAKVTWLLHIVSVTAEYKEGVLFKVKVFGIPVYDMSKAEEKAAKREARQKSKPKHRKPKEAKKPEKAEKIGTQTLTEADKAKTAAAQMKVQAVGSESREAASEKPEQPENAPENLTFLQKIKLFFGKIKELSAKVLQFFKNIKYTFDSLCDKIRSTANQAAYYKEIWEKEETKQALHTCKKQLGRLFRHLKPSKLYAYLHIGMSDPAATGQLLAVHGMLYPLIGANVRIVPDFENEVLEGSLFIKGRVTVFVLLRTAWILYFDKNIKYLIRLLKKEDK